MPSQQMAMEGEGFGKLNLKTNPFTRTNQSNLLHNKFIPPSGLTARGASPQKNKALQKLPPDSKQSSAPVATKVRSSCFVCFAF